MSAPYAEDQFTDWFPPSVKPLRPGLYSVKLLDGDRPDGDPIFVGVAKFNGRFWSSAYSTLKDHESWHCGLQHFQNKPWRGLNFDPAQPAPSSTKTALQQFAESIEFSGPDGDGLFWMRAGVPGGLKMALNLGPERVVVARAAAQLEQLRVKALMECKR